VARLLVIVIYITFITLGLPDTILGVAWPSMRDSMNLPLEAAGVITMVVTSFTAASSFASGFAVEKIGTGKVVLISNLLTASALLGYSFSPSFWWLLIFSLPLGLGAGAIDAAINNFVATHYSARHMNWLHCFWGIGALMGPGIVTFYLATAGDWRAAYQVIAFMVLIVGIIVGLSLSLWKMETLGEKKQVKTGKEYVPGTCFRSAMFYFRFSLFRYTSPSKWALGYG
jgi:MFS family permease